MRFERLLITTSTLLCSTLAIFLTAPIWAAEAAPLRPPAVPLVVHDPLFSIWSQADRLTDRAPQHWTGRPHPLSSLIRVDGKAYRLMGDQPKDVTPLPQTKLTVWPTRTVYEFEGAGLHATLTFTTPSLPDDLAVLARPVTYLTWDVRSIDGANHAVTIYDSIGGQLAVNDDRNE